MLTKEELKQYLIDNAGYFEDRVDSMNAYDLVDAWLNYSVRNHGIIGFIHDILQVIKASGYFNEN